MLEAKVGPQLEWPALNIVELPIAAAKKRLALPKGTLSGPNNGTPAPRAALRHGRGKRRSGRRWSGRNPRGRETKAQRQEADAL